MRHLQSFLSLRSSKLQQCYLPDHVSISTSAIFGNAGAGGRVRQQVGGGVVAGAMQFERGVWYILFGDVPKLS